ncbi:hypothetical protein ACQKEI_05230 [Psychrobacter namhaensis]|uniref:hypothetical protein n=1 Tax=Psychrobacter namhaensis TaxID=292734 RepID=UPI003D0657EE
MIAEDKTWLNKESGEPVLILRVDKMYVTYQNAQGDVGSKHPMIFLQDFEEQSE